MRKRGFQGIPKGFKMEPKMKPNSTQNDVLDLEGGPERPRGDFGWIWDHFLSDFGVIFECFWNCIQWF